MQQAVIDDAHAIGRRPPLDEATRQKLAGRYEAVDRRKLERLARLGAGWLALRGERGARWRVLVAALTVGEDGTRVELLEVGP